MAILQLGVLDDVVPEISCLNQSSEASARSLGLPELEHQCTYFRPLNNFSQRAIVTTLRQPSIFKSTMR